MRNTWNKVVLDKAQVRHLYLDRKWDVSQIALRLGCNIAPVYRTLKEMGITRTRSEAQSLQLEGRHPGNYKGGYKEDSGYIYIYLQSDDPFRPMADKRGYIREHRLVMAKHLGRCLEPWEIIHHGGTKYPQGSIENRGDNRIENLSLMPSQAEHLPSARMGEEIVRLRKQVADLQVEKAALLAKLAI